jgi:CRP/FNR family transcriptional regulator
MPPFLTKISADLAKKLKSRGHLRTFYEDEIIFDAGNQAEVLPIIVSGKVKMVRFPELGKEVIIGIFQSGEMFAIPPVLDGGRYPATAIALEETKLLLIYRNDFLQLMETDAELSANVTLVMCGLLRQTTATIQNLTTSSPEHRIANVLLDLAGKESNGKISLRRQDIAEMAGLTTETTIRVIRRLAAQELVKIVRGKIFIEESERLRDFAKQI